MPKVTQAQTPGTVLQSFITKYQITPFFLSKQIKVSSTLIQSIVKDQAKITVATALRLAQYFGNSPKFWIDIQVASEIDELSADKAFLSVIKGIPAAQKPIGKVKTERKAQAAAKSKAVNRKRNTLAGKRKQAAKAPGARTPKRK